MGLWPSRRADRHEIMQWRACYAALRMQRPSRDMQTKVQRFMGCRDDPSGDSVQGDRRLCIGTICIWTTPLWATAHLAASHGTDAKPRFRAYNGRYPQLAEGYVAMKPLGPVPVKGLANPVQVYEVTGAGAARTRLQVAARTCLTRFVGRDVELDELRPRASSLRPQSRVRWWGSSRGGVGKSRLVARGRSFAPYSGLLVLESNRFLWSYNALPAVIELLRHISRSASMTARDRS